MLVTTIIPVHNRPTLLQEAVASVLAQTYRLIEIVIVDDGSTDETAEVADDLARSHPKTIRVVHQPNAGPGAAREAGRKLARGELIQYLDSDDLLLPTKFELQVGGLSAHPDCGVAYGKTSFVPMGQTLSFDVPWKRTGEPIAAMFPAFLKSRWWGTSTPLYRRTLTDVVGPWKNWRCEEDWEYDCRIAALNVKLFFCDGFVSIERAQPVKLSGRGNADPQVLKDRAAAHLSIFHHAQAAGLGCDLEEMQHFSRELFLLARQCGAAGLVAEARELFRLARAASGQKRAKGWDFTLYRLLAAVVGWNRAGALACWSDGFRKLHGMRSV